MAGGGFAEVFKISNDEVIRKAWKQKYQMIRDHMKMFFEAPSIQVVLLNGVGNLYTSIDNRLCKGVKQPTNKIVHSARELFEDMLSSLGLKDICVVASPPCVALIDKRSWRVVHHEVSHDEDQSLKVQKIYLRHVDTMQLYDCQNSHIANRKRRREQHMAKHSFETQATR